MCLYVFLCVYLILFLVFQSRWDVRGLKRINDIRVIETYGEAMEEVCNGKVALWVNVDKARAAMRTASCKLFVYLGMVGEVLQHW